MNPTFVEDMGFKSLCMVFDSCHLMSYFFEVKSKVYFYFHDLKVGRGVEFNSKCHSLSK